MKRYYLWKGNTVFMSRHIRLCSSWYYFKEVFGRNTVLGKIRNETKLFSRKSNSLIKDKKSSRSEIKLTNTQLNKLKTAAKYKTGTTSRIT